MNPLDQYRERHLSPEEITARACQLWQISGSPAGRDAEFWLAAEAELRHERWEIVRALESARKYHRPSRRRLPAGQPWTQLGAFFQPHVHP